MGFTLAELHLTGAAPACDMEHPPEQAASAHDVPDVPVGPLLSLLGTALAAALLAWLLARAAGFAARRLFGRRSDGW